MPANDSLLKYLDSMNKCNKEPDNKEQIPEDESIDELLNSIKDDHTKRKIRVKVKPRFNKSEPNVLDIEEQSDKKNTEKLDITEQQEKQEQHGSEQQISDIDAFLARAEAEAAKKLQSNNKTDYCTTIPGKPKVKEIPEEIPEEFFENNNIKVVDYIDDEPSVPELIQMSETKFPDEWIEIYEKAQRSKKRNYATAKIKAGRFRINNQHQVEILADKDTHDMTADDLLNDNWI